MPRMLIIEDEVGLARAMADALGEAGHEVHTIHVGEKALAGFKQIEPEVVLLDLRLGGVSGLELLDQFKRLAPETEVIVVTAYGSVEVAVDAMKRGAAEFLTKPIDLDVLAVAVERVCSASRDRRRLRQYRTAQAGQLGGGQLIGHCPALQSIREQVARFAQRAAAASQIPAILLTGETGTGKDLLATTLHAALAQRTGPFVALNCSAVPADLFESELFGHIRGAFTGATADKAGMIETADGGTLFLDEVGELPLALQPKLLRALETRTLRRVGDTRDRAFDVCLIAATNRRLSDAVQAGKFREDLLYRLKVVSFELPPLRERGDDVLLLADHFCRRLAAKYDLPELTLSPAARQRVAGHRWPGNVRELQHALESAALSITGTCIEPADLPLPAGPDPVAAAEAALDAQQPIDLEQIERALIERALHRTAGNVSAAARLLSIGREAMRYRMSKFGLNAEP